VTAFTPVEKIFVSTGQFFRNGWHNYADLRGIRKQNRELQDEVTRLQMEQVRLKQDADQARRLQVLLEFKEKFISKTVAAQVIATSGTEQSRLITIDKGSNDHIKPDMPVITPDGIVGKIKEVFPLSSQVLLINDHDSGAGVILESSRLQGIVKGTSLGELQINDIMSDEKVEPGERVITSGGDRIYPKGYTVGTVIGSTPDHDNDPFLIIKIKPAADISRLEEVLVITKMSDDSQTAASGPAPMRAADILSQRLPSVPKVDPNAPKTPGGIQTSVPAAKSSPTPANKPVNTGAEQKRAAVTGAVKPPAPASGTSTLVKPAAPASGTSAASTAKPGAEAKKPSSGQTQASATVSAETTQAKPKPTPKKVKTPAVAPDSTAPDQPASAPTATPTPANQVTGQEKPPR
jgi:rod shape-determining protein MreC